MKQSSYFLLTLCFLLVLLASWKQSQNTFEKISVREFELTDDQGKPRVSIKVESTDEVVFRLRDSKGDIRVKLAASKDGSGLVLLDENTNPGLHVTAKGDGANLTLFDKEGKKRRY